MIPFQAQVGIALGGALLVGAAIFGCQLVARALDGGEPLDGVGDHLLAALGAATTIGASFAVGWFMGTAISAVLHLIHG